MDFKKQKYLSIICLLLVFLLSSCLVVSEPAHEQPAEQAEVAEPEEEEQEAQETEEPAYDAPVPEEAREEHRIEMDIHTKRDFFTKGVDHFSKGQYVQAQFYFNRIEDSYLILQDHIFYYLAKSLLMQEKYSLSEEYYAALIEDHSHSIWAEKANLEYADLFFMQQKYARAEELYQLFYENYPQSDFVGYSLFQLAVCQERNQKPEEAIHSYKQVWLNFPTNDYAQPSLSNLERIIETHEMEPWTPTADQVFNRAQLFFSQYHYHSALDQLNHILNNYDISSLMEARVLFRMGMCYYNLRDYGQARDYLLSAYQISEGSGIADDALYFLGRAETNLGRREEAISYYQKLMEDYPRSNLSDDALYRLGRIYFFDNQMDKAIESYKRVVEEYPGGDRFSEVLWELGWIYYNTGDWDQAKGIFSNMSASFKGTELEEKGLFWKAKSLSNEGKPDEAIELFKQIVSINSYSYYTFVSQKILEGKEIYIEIPPIDHAANPLDGQIVEIVPQVFLPLEDNGSNDNHIPLHIRKAIELLKIEMFSSASAEIEAGQDEIENDPFHILMLSTLYYQSQDYRNSISMLVRNHRNLRENLESPYKDYYYYLLYPYGFRELVDHYAQQYDTDPLFVLAVMRQESRFQSHVSSFAGARGLMQIMPATGKGIAQQLKIENFDVDQLFEPEKSIMMGTYYLRQQLNTFGGNMFYASGAYNGGSGNMSNWISRWGDKDIYEFVENIPFDETRDYVKKVMANYYLYQMLYN